ncbi:MAG TPA: CDGSH iron-sulfur domain-containing protein [Actinomycetota bacterium]|jgi:CDGSH-type Zn-finger protein|nr:CDGSH iron-sulfur domain-containing protein [Actinomycetota bacterium]
MAGIEIEPNGAYIVSGAIPLVRVHTVYSEQDEPIEWLVDDAIEAPETYRLCRCGNCSMKPFADDGGCANFDGTESAPTESYDDRAKTLGGTTVTIRDFRKICSHAGFCANRITNVWKAAKVLDDDKALQEQTVEMVRRCPSGALTYSVDGAVVEPDLPVQIGVETDGPYRVTGGIPVTRADGQTFETRNRVSLCRCGQSSNKPLCDGTHKEIGFTG